MASIQASPTLVTALLDLGRGDEDAGLSPDHQRDFSDYLHHFRQLLAVDAPLVIYTSPDLEDLVWRSRLPNNTCVRRLTLAMLESNFEHFGLVQEIRQSQVWRDQASWLGGSPQSRLAHYNPLVMSKLFMLDEVASENPFSSDSFFWVDAGITRTCGRLVTNTDWSQVIESSSKTVLALSYPYESAGEIHGFSRRAMTRWTSGTDTKWVVRGGLFGGKLPAIASVKRVYDQLLRETLQAGFMGTEESVLTMAAHSHPALFQREMLEEDGLLRPFFTRRLKIDEVGNMADLETRASPVAPAPLSMPAPNPSIDAPILSVYLLTFNSPEQLSLALNSWQPELRKLSNYRLFIVDNSTDQQSALKNTKLCRHYGGVHLPQKNLGISGGRQCVAEHFDASGATVMLFLEDDMLLSQAHGRCANGMPRHQDNLLPRAQRVLLKENLDFLKLSFTEYYGNNSQQWAWHNVPEERRGALWPDHPRRSDGLALDDIPPTHFDFEGREQGLGYKVGEVYYCNWPQLVSRAGNKKLFLEKRFDRPHESLWMAHFYECSRRKQLRSAVLLASPIDHRREFHYQAEERLES